MSVYNFGGQLFVNGKPIQKIEDVMVGEEVKAMNSMRKVNKALKEGTVLEPTQENAASLDALKLLASCGVKRLGKEVKQITAESDEETDEDDKIVVRSRGRPKKSKAMVVVGKNNTKQISKQK